MDIHVYLTGRLGNQLFQYAFARQLQKKYGGKIICNTYDLDERSEKLKHIPGKFHYDMANFKLNDNIELESRKLPWYADFFNPFIRVTRKLFPKLLFNIMSKFNCLLWRCEDYVNIPDLSKAKSVILNGWWQDFRYFHDVEKELQQEVVTTLPPCEDNKELYDIIEGSNSVCISIRGGNYLVPKIKKKLFVCDRDFFINAVKKAREVIDNPVFIIFSDDLKWSREYIRLEEEFPDCKFYYESGKDTVEEKIQMMTKCKHFIISNSTFSWWAQYLAPYKDKTVIAPDIWFPDGSKIPLYMDNWTLISTKKLND